MSQRLILLLILMLRYLPIINALYIADYLVGGSAAEHNSLVL